jgi:hypothetical protein
MVDTLGSAPQQEGMSVKVLLVCAMAVGMALLPRGASADLVDVPTLQYEAHALPEESIPAWGRNTTYVPVAEIVPPDQLHIVIDGSPENTRNDSWYLGTPIPPGEPVIFAEVRAKIVLADGQDNLIEFTYG